MKVKKSVITAGGEGTRLLPCSEYVPKEMFPVGNIPTIDFAIKECIAADISEIFIVINERKELLIKYLTHKLTSDSEMNNVKLRFVPQLTARGTAKAIESCADCIGDEPFYVIFPDEINIEGTKTGSDMCSAYEKNGKSVIGLKKVAPEERYKYGIAGYTGIDDGLYSISHIVEKPKINAPSDLALSGRYVFSPEIFDEIGKSEQRGKEYYLTDAIDALAKKGKAVGYEITEKTCDTGNPRDYIKAQTVYLNYIEKAEKELKSKAGDIIQRGNGGIL